VSAASAPRNPEVPGAQSSRSGTRRASVELFLISFMILFLELACIRWLGSTVIFLTFFTNIVLMACFLGVSVGCLAASRSWSWINALVPLALVITASACGILWTYINFIQIMIDVGSQQSPQLIYFGTDARTKDPTKWVVPIELLSAYFFVLVALLFVGPGQEMGRRFAAIDNRLTAYTADILGSLAGITVFGAMAVFRVPAWIWFLIAIGIGIAFIPRRRFVHALAGLAVLAAVGLADSDRHDRLQRTRIALAALAVVGLADWPQDTLGPPTEVVWSPYYQVRFKPRYLSIDVNNLGHQGMLPVDRAGPAYILPHLLNRDAGNKPFDDVLIIGAGSGNDVAAALAQKSGHVDAVEIDPVINELGRLHHPNRPYSDSRVSVFLDDGRSFVRKTPGRYDLISYALVDSLALHSSYSSVRLESFLFTEQAFRDVKDKLKPGGVFAMYNFYRRGWVLCRLVKLVEKVFGTKPLVLTLPYQSVVSPGDNQGLSITFVLAGDRASNVLEAIRSQFAAKTFYWLNLQPESAAAINGFGPAPPARSRPGEQAYVKVGPAEVELTGTARIPTDDWPFLYLREPTIPALNLRGIAIVAVLSLAILFAFAPVRRVRPSARMFFLGAGFMLLETKGLVHMALLFGATWMVNSIVFFAILAMILLSNLYVLAVNPRRLWPYYALLLAALLVNTVVPMDDFLALPGMSKVIVSCTIVFLPVFFAGVIFATNFRSSERPDVDLGSNIGGIILGGLSENLSLVFGFNHLLWFAIGFYVFSAVLKPAGGSSRSS
jgi:SAM-dependent methyltransferase